MIITYDKQSGIKRVISSNYNYVFDSKTGEFARWGKTQDDNPVNGPVEICDLEVSEVCSGIPRTGETTPVVCGFCYKTNTKVGRNMSFDTFKIIFNKLPKTLTQVAFGIGDLDSNKDLTKMFEYCRNNDHNPGVVPNLTINGWGLTDEWVNTLANNLGGIAVSRYENKDVCYNAVEKLTTAGMKQVNIHQLISNETLKDCYNLVDDVVKDPRLAKLKAVVFLTLKPKGKRNKLTTLKNVEEYRKLIEYAFKNNVSVGFDSCSAPTFLAAMKEHPMFEKFAQLSESCESDRFSGYINVEGIWSHCSFTEGIVEWGSVDMKTVVDFDSEVWNSECVKKFRNCLTCQDNSHIAKDMFLCPVYKLYDDYIGNSTTAKDSHRK